MPVNIMKAIEKREGKPIREILIEVYPRYSNQADVAKALGISQPTLSQWLVRLELKVKTILVPSAVTEQMS
jgi:transcriptional regulator with PAS, ATPase and Fis domain